MFLRRCLRWCCWRDRADLGQTAARFMPVLCSRRPSAFKGKTWALSARPICGAAAAEAATAERLAGMFVRLCSRRNCGETVFAISSPKCHGAALKSSQCKMFSKDRSFTVNAAQQNMKRSDARLCVCLCGFGSFFVCVSHGRLFLVCLL